MAIYPDFVILFFYIMSNYSPKEIIEVANKAAFGKDSYSLKKILVLAFLAGAYISFGGLLAIIIGGGVPGLAQSNPGIQIV